MEKVNFKGNLIDTYGELECLDGMEYMFKSPEALALFSLEDAEITDQGVELKPGAEAFIINENRIYA